MLGRLGVLGAGGTQGVAEVDRALAHFYRREPKRLALSVGCHFCGWVASAFETWIILRLLHVPVPFATAVVIEAVGTAVRFATFMVPAHLGAIEGGHVLAFVTLGLEAAAGMSFTLVRRLREAAWVGLGFLVLTAIRTAAPTPATRQAEI